MFLAGVLGCALAGHPAAAAPPEATEQIVEAPAELVLRGAQVITMNPARPTATAVAVRGGIIVYVGDDAGVDAYVGPRTRVIAGSPSPAAATAGPGGHREMTVLPGLIDAHAHLISLGLSLDQRGPAGQAVDSRDPCRGPRHARQAGGSASRAEWLEGSGWDQNLFTPARFPAAAERRQLDAITGKRPTFLRRIDGHAGWANTEAYSAPASPATAPPFPGA